MKRSKTKLKCFSALLTAIENETDEAKRIDKMELLCRKICACAFNVEIWALNLIADCEDRDISFDEVAKIIRDMENES